NPPEDSYADTPEVELLRYIVGIVDAIEAAIAGTTSRSKQYQVRCLARDLSTGTRLLHFHAQFYGDIRAPHGRGSTTMSSRRPYT
ncbi:MAG: hypothetical protein ACKPKO_05780, partial [Candidatus Fonsibacter sp.]